MSNAAQDSPALAHTWACRHMIEQWREAQPAPARACGCAPVPSDIVTQNMQPYICIRSG